MAGIGPFWQLLVVVVIVLVLVAFFGAVIWIIYRVLLRGDRVDYPGPPPGGGPFC